MIQELDPNQSLIASMMQDPQQAAYKMHPAFQQAMQRYRGSQQSARITPQNTQTPFAQHVASAASGLNAAETPQTNGAGADPSTPAGYAYAQQQAAQRQQGGQAQPAAGEVTLGDQYGPMTPEGEPEYQGRNVQLIRGGQSQIQHFNAQGTNTGAAQPQTAVSSPDTKPEKPQDWKKANEQDLTHYNILERHANHLDSELMKAQQSGLPVDPQQQTLSQQIHSQMNEITGRLFTPPQPKPTPVAASPAAVSPETKDVGSMQEAITTAHQGGIPKAPKPGTAMSVQLAQMFLKNAGGDKDKARQLAKDAGWDTAHPAKADDTNWKF